MKTAWEFDNVIELRKIKNINFWVGQNVSINKLRNILNPVFDLNFNIITYLDSQVIENHFFMLKMSGYFNHFLRHLGEIFSFIIWNANKVTLWLDYWVRLSSKPKLESRIVTLRFGDHLFNSWTQLFEQSVSNSQVIGMVFRCGLNF